MQTRYNAGPVNLAGPFPFRDGGFRGDRSQGSGFACTLGYKHVAPTGLGDWDTRKGPKGNGIREGRQWTRFQQLFVPAFQSGGHAL